VSNRNRRRGRRHVQCTHTRPVYDHTYKTPSGEAIRARMHAYHQRLVGGAEYGKLMNPQFYADLMRVLPMLDAEQRGRIGEIDRRHTIILEENGVEHIPAFQFDQHERLRDDAVYVNEEIAADVSPWMAVMLWTVEGALEVESFETGTVAQVSVHEMIGLVPKEFLLRAIRRMHPFL
jgi:hypothetical protein